MDATIMKAVLFFIAFVISFTNSTAFLNENEVKIVSQMINNMQIKQAIFLTRENYPQEIVASKIFSAKRFPSIQLSGNQLINYINQTDCIYSSILIILKEENGGDKEEPIKKIVEKFKSITGQYYKLSRYKWFVFVKDLYKYYNMPIRYDCEFIIIQQIINTTTFKIVEIYTTEKRSFVSDFGTWDSRNGIKINHDWIYLRRHDLNGTKIKRIYVKDDPFIDVRGRQFYEILDDFSNNLNFEYHLIPSAEMEKESNPRIETCHYLLGDASPLFPLGIGTDSWDMIGPILRTEINWVIKYPDTKLRSDFFLQPFEMKMWTAIIFILIVGTAASLVISEKNENRSFTDNLFVGIETFCNQSGCDAIYHASLRIVCFSLRITALTLIGSFGAVVTSYLAIRIPDIPFRDWDEFVENGQFNLVINGYTSAHFYIALYKPLGTEYVYKTNSTIFYENLEEMETRLCHENIAYVYLDNDIYEKKFNCHIYQIKESIGFMWLVSYATKRNPYTKLFSYHLLRHFESGIIKRMQGIVNKTISEMKTEEYNPIEIKQMVQILSLPFIGIILGISILFAEISVLCCSKS